MNFEFSEEQVLLKESVQRWAQDNYSFEQRRLAVQQDNGFSAENWASFAELGWLSIPFSEQYGGYAGSIVDLAAVLQEFGKALVVEPMLPTVVLFGGALQNCADEAIKAELIPQIIDGSLLGALAVYEPQSHFDASNIVTSAQAHGDEYRITGNKSVVLGGAYAQKILVLARTNGKAGEQQGLSLFMLDANATGVTVNPCPLMDGQHAADLVFANAPAQLLGELDGAHAPIMKVLDDAQIALSSEAIGIMEKLNKTTVEYTKTRQQFGVPISSFQALQHRMVDTFMAFEQCRSLWIGALCELSDENTNAQQTAKMVNALRVLVAKNGKQIGNEAIQMHGGMGITDELDVGHYVKRLMMINLLFGNGDFFQEQFNQVAYG